MLSLTRTGQAEARVRDGWGIVLIVTALKGNQRYLGEVDSFLKYTLKWKRKVPGVLTSNRQNNYMTFGVAV